MQIKLYEMSYRYMMKGHGQNLITATKHTADLLLIKEKGLGQYTCTVKIQNFPTTS